jgi:hypothetical protein
VLPDAAAGSRSQPSGSGAHRSFIANVRRYGSKDLTTVPNGVSVVSSSRFISAVSRPGTYQLSAAAKLHTSILHLVSIGHFETLPLPGIGRFASASDYTRSNAGFLGKAMIAAPVLETLCRTAARENLCIERLDERERLEPRDIRVRPRRLLLSGDNRQRQRPVADQERSQHDRDQDERDAFRSRG